MASYCWKIEKFEMKMLHQSCKAVIQPGFRLLTPQASLLVKNRNLLNGKTVCIALSYQRFFFTSEPTTFLFIRDGTFLLFLGPVSSLTFKNILDYV